MPPSCGPVDCPLVQHYYGSVWDGSVWDGMGWDEKWDGMMRFGTALHGTVRYGTAQNATVYFSSVAGAACFNKEGYWSYG